MTAPGFSSTTARELLRHTVATVAYRAGKAVREAPPEFLSYKVAETSRTPAQILAHMGDLFDWALSIARGEQKWQDSEPLPWHGEVERFFAALAAFDDFLASKSPLAPSPEKLFQGPVADALAHVGQLTLLRRAAGAPIRGENYFKAEVNAGVVGSEQAAPKFEFE
jgi:hypothetical protein